jgi:hypothetical protein
MAQTLGSERISIVSVIDPDDQAAGTVTGDWVKADDFLQYMALLNVGVMTTSGTLVFSVQQATDGTGTAAKAVKTATTLTEAGSDDDKQVIINIDPDELDLAGGFLWIAPRIVTAVDASLCSATLLGLDPVFGYDAAKDLASVDEIV